MTAALPGFSHVATQAILAWFTFAYVRSSVSPFACRWLVVRLVARSRLPIALPIGPIWAIGLV